MFVDMSHAKLIGRGIGTVHTLNPIRGNRGWGDGGHLQPTTEEDKEIRGDKWS